MAVLLSDEDGVRHACTLCDTATSAITTMTTMTHCGALHHTIPHDSSCGNSHTSDLVLLAPMAPFDGSSGNPQHYHALSHSYLSLCLKIALSPSCILPPGHRTLHADLCSSSPVSPTAPSLHLWPSHPGFHFQPWQYPCTPMASHYPSHRLLLQHGAEVNKHNKAAPAPTDPPTTRRDACMHPSDHTQGSCAPTHMPCPPTISNMFCCCRETAGLT